MCMAMTILAIYNWYINNSVHCVKFQTTSYVVRPLSSWLIALTSYGMHHCDLYRDLTETVHL